MEEANKLIGQGKKQLVMGKVVEAVSTLQEACGMLAKQYGDTADECGEALYWCGKALLDLARMENSVLGNALQGVPEEEEDAEEEKPKDSNVEMESTESLDEKTRDELRVQVYDAMAEKKEEATEKAADEKKDDSTTEKADAEEKTDSTSDVTKDDATEKEDKTSGEEPITAEKPEAQSAAAEKTEEGKSKSPVKDDAIKEAKDEDKTSTEKPSDSDENKENIEVETKAAEKEKDAEDEMAENEQAEDDGEEMEGDEEAEETEGDEKADGEDTAEKGSDDEEVGNLQLAWEMLEVAKVIYKRKDTKEDQLMAAQTHLKLGEVSAESGNYTQAIEDFQECLKLQLKHLESDSRLLAETHYQLGLTYSLNCQYKQAIDELNSSIAVIKSRLEKLQELIDKAEGPDALPDERKEMEELKALLPEIQEKVEDSSEGLKTASSDVEAVKGVLDGSVTAETGEKQISTKANGTPSEKTTASDISHLVRKKRKPEESPVKEVKKVKQDEAQTNGAEKSQMNGDTNCHTKEHGNSQSTSMEVEST